MQETELRTLFDAPVTTARFTKSDYSGYNISCDGYNDGSIWVSSIRSWYLDGTDTLFVSTRAPYTYLWTASDGGVITGSATDSILVNVPAGTYHLTVTDSWGCQFHFTDTLTEPDGIDLMNETVSSSADGNYEISCFGRNDGFITLAFDGGAGAYSYAWTGPNGYTATTASIANLTAGAYQLTVTDGNSCHKIYPYLLEEPDSVGINVDKSLTTDGSFNISCSGDDGTIDITVSGGSGPGTYTYDWRDINNPAWSSTLEDQTIKAGSYRVYVTDANGCTNDRGVVMTEPAPLTAALAVSEITCLTAPAFNDGEIDLTVNGGRLPYSFAWEGPSGYTSGAEDITGLTPGDYLVTVTDGYGCIITADTTLAMPEPLTIDTLKSNYNGFSVSCLGRSDGWIKVIPLTGTGPYDFTWSGPGGFTATATDSIYGLREGVYTVTVTDRHLCTITGNIMLESPGPLSMTLNIWPSAGGNFDINCNGGATGRVDITPVNAAGTPTYLWSDGLAGASRNDLRAGMHEVIITDANGCIADTTLTLTEPDSLVISFSMISPFCPESTDGTIFAGVTGGEGAYSFSWSNGQTTQEVSGLTAGFYRVEARDFNGCAVTDSLTLGPLNEICVGIPNAFSPDGDGINEVWNIARITLYSEAEVIILNRWGEMVWKSAKGLS